MLGDWSNLCSATGMQGRGGLYQEALFRNCDSSSFWSSSHSGVWGPAAPACHRIWEDTFLLWGSEALELPNPFLQKFFVRSAKLAAETCR